MDTIQKMLSEARNRAFVPFSGFAVGCVIEDIFGRFFCGANSEYDDRNAGLCAESCAIADMCSMVGAAKIKNLYLCGGIVGKYSEEPVLPCGLCRQRIAELSDEKTNIICAGTDGNILKTFKFSEIFPLPFSLSETADFRKILETKRPAIKLKKGDDIRQKLQELYDFSYPLSNKKEAVIIELENGGLIGGNYFGTSCYKADIKAKTAANARLLFQAGTSAKIRKVHSLG